jgi:hypothetical protein
MLIMRPAARPLNEPEMDAWRTFYEMQEVLRGRLEQQLQADSGLSNADYTVLVQRPRCWPHDEHRTGIG